MSSRISTIESTASFVTPDIDTPRQHLLNQHAPLRQNLQTVFIRFKQAVFPKRAQKTTRLSSAFQKAGKVEALILSTDNSAKDASAPRARAKHDTAPSMPPEAIGGPEAIVSAVAFGPDPRSVEALPLTIYSAEFRAKFPAIFGHRDDGIFIESPDGKYRRFPVDNEGRTIPPPPDPQEMIGPELEQLTDLIYDAHKDWIHETIAGYAMDAQGATVQFEVSGKPVSSICEYPATFALPNHKWMIAQPEYRACTHACEEMLLAEGKSEVEVLEQLRHPSCRLLRKMGLRFWFRNTEQCCDSLEARSGRKPLVIKGKGLTARREILKLKRGIAKHGPCIFGMTGHARILDAIEETEHGFLFTVRDPFTASVLTIKPHETFETHRMAGDEFAFSLSRQWDAIFLPKTRPSKLHRFFGLIATWRQRLRAR